MKIKKNASFYFFRTCRGSKGNQIVGIVKTALPVSRKETLKQTKLKFFIFLSEAYYFVDKETHTKNNLIT